MICIAGYGYVGQATHKMLDSGPGCPVDVIIDTDKGLVDYDLARKCDIVFVCVPTPQGADGSCDTKEVRNVMKTIGRKPLYVIRSTVPWTFEMPGYNMVAAPEFLSMFEFLDSTHKHILGGSYNNLRSIIKLYDKLGLEYIATTWEAACQVKYTSNLYGAFKVSFWNMIQDITHNERLVYNLLKDLNIKQGDMAQVGMDGTRGFGGACFPKDINAVNTIHPHTLLQAVIDYNEVIRHGKES